MSLADTTPPTTELARLNAGATAAAFETKAQRAVAFATKFVIESDDDYMLAAEELRNVKARGNAVEDERVKITGPMNTALQAVNDLFRGPKALFASVEGIYKAKMIQWQAKKEREAEIARQRAEEAARVERERLAAIAEQQAQDGHTEEAQATMLEAETVVAQPLAVDKPRAAGISTAKSLEVTVANKYEFVKFCVDAWERDPGMLDYLNIDSVKLRAAGRTHGTALNWPGLAIGGKSTIRVR